jgi:hypothetical protein
MNVSYTLGLVVDIICAVVAYRLAVKKDRNPVGWTLLGFFFGPIGLIIVALLPPRRPAPY